MDIWILYNYSTKWNLLGWNLTCVGGDKWNLRSATCTIVWYNVIASIKDNDPKVVWINFYIDSLLKAPAPGEQKLQGKLPP